MKLMVLAAGLALSLMQEATDGDQVTAGGGMTEMEGLQTRQALQSLKGPFGNEQEATEAAAKATVDFPSAVVPVVLEAALGMVSRPQVADALEGKGEAERDAAVAAAPDEYASACAAGNPVTALIGKYNDRVPVQIKSRAHLGELISAHGKDNVQVSS